MAQEAEKMVARSEMEAQKEVATSAKMSLDKLKTEHEVKEYELNN